LKRYFKTWKREAEKFSLHKEEKKKKAEENGGEYRVVIVGEEQGTEDFRFSTLREHERRFIGDGMDPEFLLSKKMAGKGDKELDRKARREQRRKHIAEINRVKLEKEQERFLVRNALETTMGLGLKDIFSTL
jgi:hypothetical protein